MILVLNKSDSAEAATHVQRIAELSPDIVSIPISARSECLLQRCVRDGLVEYKQGADNFQWNSEVGENILCLELDSISNDVLKV